MSTHPTIVIADDHPILREGLRDQFSGTGQFTVVGAVGDAQSAVNLCRERRPDLLLLDVEMPGRDALGAIADIKAASPNTRIVVFTAFCRDAVIDVAVRAGVAGYLLKSDSPSNILACLARVLSGERVYSMEVLGRLSPPAIGRERGDSSATLISTLSRREMEVLRSIGKGMTNAEMAEAMHLSIRTVERHVFRLMRHMKIDDRTRLAVLARESGLLN